MLTVHFFILIALAFTLQTVKSFQANFLRPRLRLTSRKAIDVASIITSAVEVSVKPDDYVYGAVAAPDWVLPVSAVFVVLTG